MEPSNFLFQRMAPSGKKIAAGGSKEEHRIRNYRIGKGVAVEFRHPFKLSAPPAEGIHISFDVGKKQGLAGAGGRTGNRRLRFKPPHQISAAFFNAVETPAFGAKINGLIQNERRGTDFRK